MKSVIRLIFLTTTWLLLIYSTYELGMWQLHRAQAMNVATAAKPDQPLIALTDVASAGMNLPIKAVNRIVYADGIYSTSYMARDQKIAEEKLANLDVRLLKLSSGHSVLVVRGVASEPLDEINSDIYLTGRLYPRQNVDRAFSKPGELSRIDPALVVSKANPFLYDGYIVLQSEKIGGKSSNASFIPTPQITQKVAGFYWQHISYVVVWWFMGALLLIAPLFPQFRAPRKVIKSGVKK
jgi:cytochrome oxidase assembly protein ShyY1